MARLSITTPDPAYKALEDYASSSGRLLADIAREALEEYLKRRGVDTDFKVKRGGDRRSK